MKDINLNEILDGLKDQIIDLAKKHAGDFKDLAVNDAEELVKNSREDIERWTRLLASNDITQKEYKFLMGGLKDEAEMKALKQQGLAKIKVDRFKKDLFNLLINTVFEVV